MGQWLWVINAPRTIEGDEKVLQSNRIAPCLLGALVADAAALGLHWLYDVDRLASVVGDGSAAFVPLSEKNYADVTGFYAHGGRKNGMGTQYGDALFIAMRSMMAMGGVFDVADYQKRFAGWFGSNDTIYIDRPTEGTLKNIADGVLDPSGVDDDQLPAISRLPAVVCAYATSDDLGVKVEEAVRVTNDNDEAVAYAWAFATALVLVLNGAPISEALRAAVNNAQGDVKLLLERAVEENWDTATDFAGDVGRACHLPMGMPVAFHICMRAHTYREAVEMNIRAGGDSAGRAIVIGALMGAEHGIERVGIPLEWILATTGADKFWRVANHLQDLA